MSIANEIARLQTAKADIKTAIEQKGVTVGDGTIDTYAEKISEISGGGESVNLLEYATEISYLYIDAVFPDGYELNLNLPNVTSFVSAFNGAKGIEKITIKGNTAENVVIFTRAFRNCSAKVIDLTEFNAKLTGDMTMAFYSGDIVEVLGELDCAEVTSFNNAFYSSILTTVAFKKETIKRSIGFASCKDLSALSIQSIIDGLAQVDTAQTLTLHANVKLLQSQVDSANAKGWTIAGGTVVSEEEYYA